MKQLTTQPKLSVILTAYNQHELTVVHVRECMNLTVMPDEIIVVNDNGDPSLKDMLKKLELKTKVIYAYILDDIPWNYTGARNLGVWLSKGDYLIMEDNDHIPTKDAYEKALKFADDNPDVGRILFDKRHKVYLKDVLVKPIEQWETFGDRVKHEDTQLLKRKVYLKLKGCDERFAGRYAWACTDWRRRIQRNGIKTGTAVGAYYYALVDGETKVCMCGKSKEERTKTIYCKDCKLMFKRKSYKNYEMTRGANKYLQSPIGILNFNYTFEEL